MIEKIISGGQTGADRAALDMAIETAVPHGGRVPKGRKTEDGRLSAKYHVQETNAIDYAQRTGYNILDSDGTLIISHGNLKGGSSLTRKLAQKHHRSCLHIDLDTISEYRAVEIIQTWIESKDIRILNVAGPRASEDPMIYDDVQNILRSLLYPL
ncbi:putative molybdenum carrier protein [Thermodesulfobacteriota bacterium]